MSIAKQDAGVPPEKELAVEVDAPELTWRSGLAVAGAALSYFLSVGFLNAYGVFQYLRDKSNFQISWLGSFGTFAIFAFAPAAGILADKIGPQLPIAAGSVALVLAAFMVSLCTKYYQFFLAQAVLMGMGMSFIAIPASGMVPRYFVRHRGVATGVSVAGSSLGGVLWPIAFDRMLHRDGIGFPWAMRIAGFVMIPLCVFCVLTVRPPVVVPKPVAGERVEEGGVHEAGGEAEQKKDLRALRQPPFLLLCAGLFVGIFGFAIPLFYTSVYAVHIGLSASMAFYLVSILNGASLFGRILPGIVADRFGRFNMLALSMFAASLVVFCWTAATSAAGLVVWAVAFGFSSGALLSLQLACATTLVDASQSTTVIGAVMGSTSLAMLFATPIAGELIKHGYIAPAAFGGATLFVGACLITAARLCLSRDWTARI
ncbi:hypothetical protein LTR53_017197 [Teratosphaeriaceae sp. CCFEE 6253]|nr:hypothetical protein LTR53_017197 [Teratosphaeriaceae sp. CCFEE 6253]